MKIKNIKILSLILVCFVCFGSLTFSAQAQWVVDFPGNGFGAALDNIIVFIKETIYAAAKKAAMQAVIKEINNKIGGSSGDAKFITDWRDALQTQPDRVTTVQVKNLFSTMGGGTEGNYVSTSGSSSYASSMLKTAQDSVLDTSIPEVINMAEYGVDDPSEVFDQDNMKAFMTAYGSSGKIANTIEATLFGLAKKEEYSETNKALAQSQAIANGGYYSTTSNGQVVTPGATIRDIMASAQSMPFQSLANAKTIKEVVAALISRVVTNAVNKGIGKAKENVQKETGSGSNSSSSSIYSTYSNIKGSYGDLSATQ